MEIPLWQQRTLLLTSKEQLTKLANSHILICGLGGVGSYAAEQLARAGIGKMTLVDGDTIHETNRNRQLPALISTEGAYKAVVVANRLRDINKDLDVTIIQEYIKDQRMIDILEQGYDYVIDAIDTLSPKVYLIYHTVRLGMPLVSSMGSGGKMDPTQIKINDISETYNCRLAYYIRKKLHKLGIWNGFTTVYSAETVSKDALTVVEGERNKKSTAGTISYMPAIFGCMCASVVLRELLKTESVKTTTEV